MRIYYLNTSTTFNKTQHFAKYAIKLFLLMWETTNLFHPPPEAKTQSGCEGAEASSWWWTQMTQALPAALASCNPHGRKSKWWMETTDAVTRWKSKWFTLYPRYKIPRYEIQALYKHFLFKYFLFTNYTHWFCIVINMIIILKWYFDIILRLYRPRPPQITCAVLSIKILPITCLGKQIVLDFWSADQHFTEST